VDKQIFNLNIQLHVPHNKTDTWKMVNMYTGLHTN